MGAKWSAGGARLRLLPVLALTLALASCASGVASAAQPRGGWSFTPTLGAPDCASGCSAASRLVAERLQRMEGAAPSRHGHASARGASPAASPGSFEGTVTDAATKAGLTGIEVCAYEVKAIEEKKELEPFCGNVVTPDGTYQINLPTGVYVVEFFDPSRNYATQFYNGKTIEQNPNPVTVKAKTAKIDAAMVEGGHIEGTLTAAEGGAPLEGFLACALDFLDLGVSCAETGSGGKYLIKGLPTGTYGVGFGVPLVPGDNYLDAPLTGVEVTAGKTTVAATAALPPGGQIKGRVTAAEGGAPLAGVEVCAFSELEEEEFEECTHSGAEGKYTVERLPTGSYEVEFFDPPEYLTQFYAGKPHVGEANEVSVTAGKAVEEIDAAMLSPTLHNGVIEGHVTSAGTKAALAGVEVCAISGSGEECKPTDAGGNYVLEGLPEGSYKVEFFDSPGFITQWWNNKTSLALATPVSVAAATPTVSAVDAVMQPVTHGGTGAIEGHVTSTWTGGALVGVEVCAISASSKECSPSGAGGAYKVEGLAEGSYKVEFFAAKYVKQFWNGKPTAELATPVSVTTTTVTGIDAAMQPAGVIEGHVTSAVTFAPLAEVEVCAFSVSGEECVETNASGAYAIRGLPEGSYGVEFFDEPAYETQFYKEVPFEEEATPVSITSLGQVKKGIDGKLIPAPAAAEKPAPSGPGAKPVTPTNNSPGGSSQGGTGSVLATQTVVPSLTAAGRVHVAGRGATVKLHCAIGPCHGSLQLSLKVTRRHRAHGRTIVRHVTLVVGSGTFSLAQGATAGVTIHLTAQGRSLLKAAARHPRAAKLKLILQGATTALHAVLVS